MLQLAHGNTAPGPPRDATFKPPPEKNKNGRSDCPRAPALHPPSSLLCAPRPGHAAFGAALLLRTINSAVRRLDWMISPLIRLISASTAATPRRYLGWRTVVSGTR